MSGTGRKSFVVYNDSLAVLDELSDQECGQLFRAIKAYHYGEIIELDGLVRVAFVQFKSQFKRDDDKYQRVIERNRTNGAKGGRPRNPNNPVGFLGTQITQANPKEPKKADSDSDSDSDKKDIRHLSPTAPDVVNDIFQYWVEKMGKTAATKKLPGRVSKVKARLRDGYTPEAIKQAIDGCHQSAHHMGDNADGKKYDCLSLICRDGEHIEQFIGYTTASPKQINGTSNDGFTGFGGNYI